MKSGLTWVRLFLVLLLIYLLVGALVTLRHGLRSDPAAAAQAYVEALHERDLPGIYLYSDMLGPRLAGMLEKSKVDMDRRKVLWAKDFVRFKKEFERGSKAMDSLRRERRLLHPEAEVEPVDKTGKRSQDEDHKTFSSEPGEAYVYFFKITYPSRAEAPPLGLLGKLAEGNLQRERIRSVVFRVEVEARPDIPGWQRFFMGLEFLDHVAVAFPFRDWFVMRSPSEVWMAEVVFDVDLKTLEVF